MRPLSFGAAMVLVATLLGAQGSARAEDPGHWTLIPVVLHEGESVRALRVASNDVPPSKSTAGGDDMGFDLLGQAPVAPQKTAFDLKIERKAKVRRTMLTIHQVMGLATLATLAATEVVGQLSYADKFGGHAPNDTDRYTDAHEILAFTSLAGFAATGLLGLTAPVPYPKPVRADTTLFHKICMGAATLGMMTELGLGLYTASHEGYQDQKSLAQVHQAVGLGTLVSMGAGATAFIW